MGIFCVCGANTTPPAGKIKKKRGQYQMKKLLSVVLALLMLAVMLPVTAMAAEVEVSTYEQMKTALATPGAYVKLTTNIDTTQITLM